MAKQAHEFEIKDKKVRVSCNFQQMKKAYNKLFDLGVDGKPKTDMISAGEYLLEFCWDGSGTDKDDIEKDFGLKLAVCQDLTTWLLGIMPADPTTKKK